MKVTLLYPQEHIGCCNYSILSNRLQDNGQALIDYHIPAGEVRERFMQDTEILFVLDGICRISGNGITSFRLERDDMILLPVGRKYIVQTEKDSHLMICKIPPGLELCDTYSLNRLYEEKHKLKSRGDFATIRMNVRVRNFAEQTLDCMGDGLKCVKFLRMKITELMFLLRVYYTKEALADFFYPILNKDMEFANVILTNWTNVKNKTELAALTNLSPSRFGVKFKEVFGVSPYQWLISQRSERIYYDLVYTNNTLKEISETFMFGSVQHFNDFCKKQFGKTPGQIRETKLKKAE